MSPFDDMPVYTMAEWEGQKARIAELEAELAELRGEFTDLDDVRDDAEARLAAVISLCDHGAFYELREKVRAAATEDPT